MKKLIPVLLILLTIKGFGQTSAKTHKVYKVVDLKNLFGVRVTYDTVKTDGIIDIHAFRKHFNYPMSLPDSLTSTAYKNKTFVTWANGEGVKDTMQKPNWHKTCSYDSLSRVTSFSYSGCFVCNNMPYDYKVTYNASGLIEKITSAANSFSPYSYTLLYDAQGNIKQFDYYVGTDLLRQIIMQ